ncbi:hypothetical protein ALI22I_07710 [Saccharothrix sp. ALI-22-I]|nr:hypothetical protein ALI22I_07710 [Saccharothrix sp. ALI-22-I]
MRVAVIGTGIAGRSHLLDLVTNPRFDTCAVLAQRPGRAQLVAREFGIAAAFTNVTAMLEAVNPDAVVVATPPAVTPTILRTVIDHGCLALADKPAGARAAHLHELLHHDGATSVVVGYNRRYQAHVRHCRSLLHEAGQLIVQQVRCTWRAPFATRYNSTDTYRHTARFGDGVLLDTAGHVLDTLIYLGLGPVAIRDTRAERGGAAGADVAAELLLTLAGTAQGRIDIRNDDDSDADEWRIEITTNRGRLALARDTLTGFWHDQPIIMSGSDIRRPVDDLLALAEGHATYGATLNEATEVLELLDTARHHAEKAGDRKRWQRPRAKALGRLNGSC